jgi:hypothetical protein
MTTAKKKTWKRGRRPKPKAEKQSARIVLYVTPMEAKEIQADSARAGITPSAFMANLWREWRESPEE